MMPTIPRSIEGSESSCQKPASAARPNTRSFHARLRVDEVRVHATPTPRLRGRSADSVSPTTVAIGTNGTAWTPPQCDTRRVVSTHEVQNQPPPLDGYDVYSSDLALVEAVARHDAGWATERLTTLGTKAGSAEAQEWGRLANDVPPVLHTVDRYGRRVDEVEFHPAWHQLMDVAVSNGLHASSWV